MQPGRFLYAYGIFYPGEASGTAFEAKHIIVVRQGGRRVPASRRRTGGFGRSGKIADFYLESEFGDGRDEFDFRSTAPTCRCWAPRPQSTRQETDTISRLVYGFAYRPTC